jgi:hypothetical protein
MGKHMKTIADENDVNSLLALFDRPVLLVAWPLGKKGCAGVDFNKVTPEDMADPMYLYKLTQGNIGVVQGARSGGIASIDIDDDDGAREFLALNPGLQETLRSRGARGCNIWIYPEGEAPKSCRIRCNGQPWGEWRYTGSQTIIAGLHPNGHPYTLPCPKPAIYYPFEKIVFPPGVTAPFIHASANTPVSITPDLTFTDQHIQTHRPQTVICAGSVQSIERDGKMDMATVEAVLAGATPTAQHTNHGMLFSLARQVRVFEQARQTPLSSAELEAVFSMWYERAGGYLRADQSYDEYLYEFLEAYRSVEKSGGENLIDVVWKGIDSATMPPEAALLVDPHLKKLVTLCHALQEVANPEPFFLACRTVQRLFGLSSHERGARWMRILQAKKIIKVTSPGGPTSMRASRYVYLGMVAQKPA